MRQLSSPRNSDRAIVHVVEPQHLFVPSLVDVFSEAGLTVDAVVERVDPRALLDDEPDIVFIDADFVNGPVDAVRLVHYLLPKAQVVVYAGELQARETRAYVAAGATVLLPKHLERRSVVLGLREVERRRIASLRG